MYLTFCRLLIAIFLIGVISYGDGAILMTSSIPSGSHTNGQSFSTALEQINKSFEAHDDSCNLKPHKPDYEGLRISEMECLDYIWNIKYEETRHGLGSKCPEHRISGGLPANTREFPHMSAIGWKDVKNGKWEFKCGGSLISKWFVLTAAHCGRDDSGTAPQIVRIGVVDIANQALIDEGLGVDRNIQNFTSHPFYNASYKNYDVALIKMEEEVWFDFNIRPACVLEQYDINEAIVTGWGAVSKKAIDVTSDVLLKATVLIHSKMNCKNSWKQKRHLWINYFRSDQLCAIGDSSYNSDICAGDSGGPLQTKLLTNTQQSIHNIVGVIAFNSECGSQKFPSVYTRVHDPYIINWIEREVWPKSNP